LLRYSLIQRPDVGLLRIGAFAEEIFRPDARVLGEVAGRLAGSPFAVTVVTDVPQGSLGEVRSGLPSDVGVEPEVRSYSRGRLCGNRATVVVVCRSRESFESVLVATWPYRPVAVVGGEGAPGAWEWLADAQEPPGGAWPDAAYLMVKFPHGFWVDVYSRELSLGSLRQALLDAVGGARPVGEVDEGAW
jgi:hypothetical protein